MYLLAVLEYDGTDFVGFQRQRHGRSVQEELEKALAEFGNAPVRVIGGGRTDAGVHAAGQTATFKIEWSRDLDTLLRACNAKLPRDLAVKRLTEVREGFSARREALSRTYQYKLLCQKVRAPLQERFALWVASPLDVRRMSEAAAELIGTHDFGAFGRPSRGTNCLRELKRAEIREYRPFIILEFEANAFLYRMVRRLVGTLLQVGRGQMTIEQLRKVLKRERRAGDAVPPHGLTLVSVKYEVEF